MTLMAGNKEIARVNRGIFQRGIFQGDALSSSLFVIGLILLSSPSKSKCRIPTWKGAAQKDQSPSLHE